ncbi:MAG: transglycosylase SLT domain-containing protein [Alistipes indistinctus]
MSAVDLVAGCSGEDFEAWLSHFRGSEEYAMLNDLYFEKRGIVRRVVGQRPDFAQNAGGISSLRRPVQATCARRRAMTGASISAIAYSESRFNPYVVSRKGAKGLMQVMPRVARQFGVQGDLMDPENNVLLALKVLGKIEKSLRLRSRTSPSADRMKIVLACYNAGLGHVTRCAEPRPQVRARIPTRGAMSRPT